MLEIFGKKHSSAGAVLKGTAGHNMWKATPAITSHHDVTMEKEQFFDFLLKHLKVRLSVWLGKAELLSWHSLCKAGNALPGASLSNALRMGKQNALEIFVLLKECWILKGILRTAGCASFSARPEI